MIIRIKNLPVIKLKVVDYNQSFFFANQNQKFDNIVEKISDDLIISKTIALIKHNIILLHNNNCLHGQCVKVRTFFMLMLCRYMGGYTADCKKEY